MQVMQELKRRQKAILKEFRARERKGKQLLRKIAAHEKALEMLKNEMSALFDQSGAAPAAGVNPAPSGVGGKARRTGVQRGSPTKLDCVRTILEKAGRSMSISEIVDALQSGGYAFQSEKPKAALAVMLYTHKQLFKKASPGRFTVAGANESLTAGGDSGKDCGGLAT